MRENLIISPLGAERLDEALFLVKEVFMEFEAPDFSEEGVKEFLKFVDKARIQNEMDSSALDLWVCLQAQRIVAVLGVEAKGHISLLFVSGAFHRQGIARAMLEKGLAACRQKGLTQVTVNSSPYAVQAYKRMGFIAMQPEQCIHGIRFTPMTLHLEAF